MNLTFQVPIQYCSLHHQTLLPSPVTSTTGCCFCFHCISSFFLELFLHSSPVTCWTPTNLRDSSFSVISFCLFILSVQFQAILIDLYTGGCFFSHLFPSLFFTLVPGFPGSSDGKLSAHNVGDLGPIPRLRKFPGEGNGNLLQYSCLGNFLHRGAQQAEVLGVTKSQTQLGNFTLYFVLAPLSSGLFVLTRQTGFPDGSGSTESTVNVECQVQIPASGRFPGEGNGCPLQYSGLENSTDCIVHEIAKSQTRLSNFHINTHMYTAKWRDVIKKGSIANLNCLGLRGKASQASALRVRLPLGSGPRMQAVRELSFLRREFQSSRSSQCKDIETCLLCSRYIKETSLARMKLEMWLV